MSSMFTCIFRTSSILANSCTLLDRSSTLDAIPCGKILQTSPRPDYIDLPARCGLPLADPEWVTMRAARTGKPTRAYLAAAIFPRAGPPASPCATGQATLQDPEFQDGRAPRDEGDDGRLCNRFPDLLRSSHPAAQKSRAARLNQGLCGNTGTVSLEFETPENDKPCLRSRWVRKAQFGVPSRT